MNPMPSLRAATLVQLREPLSVMSRMREHFAEHGAVSGIDEHWSVDLGIGIASARKRDLSVAFEVVAPDDSSLSLLQWSVAEHVCEFAEGERPEIVWQGGTKAGAPLPYFRALRVIRTLDVTPRMRRLTFAGRDLARFAHGGIHVRLLLPPRPGVVPVWPVMAADGRQAWPLGERPAARVYTIRRIDVAAGEVDIDFVLHEGEEMPGARFAQEAQPGATLAMLGPGGGALKPAPRYLFAGDETALPAISRMLDELPPDTRATALIEIADRAEEQALPVCHGTELHWLSREGRPAGTTSLLINALHALDAKEWTDDLFIWAGCEHAAAKAIRSFLKTERQVPKERLLVAAYWRKGTTGDPG
jgi:NADPH-dependent ferric siderophore reductase